jgi:hypothetical protein
VLIVIITLALLGNTLVDRLARGCGGAGNADRS